MHVFPLSVIGHMNRAYGSHKFLFRFFLGLKPEATILIEPTARR